MIKSLKGSWVRSSYLPGKYVVYIVEGNRAKTLMLSILAPVSIVSIANTYNTRCYKQGEYPP